MRDLARIIPRQLHDSAHWLRAVRRLVPHSRSRLADGGGGGNHHVGASGCLASSSPQTRGELRECPGCSGVERDRVEIRLGLLRLARRPFLVAASDERANGQFSERDRGDERLGRQQLGIRYAWQQDDRRVSRRPRIRPSAVIILASMISSRSSRRLTGRSRANVSIGPAGPRPRASGR